MKSESLEVGHRHGNMIRNNEHLSRLVFIVKTSSLTLHLISDYDFRDNVRNGNKTKKWYFNWIRGLLFFSRKYAKH